MGTPDNNEVWLNEAEDEEDREAILILPHTNPRGYFCGYRLAFANRPGSLHYVCDGCGIQLTWFQHVPCERRLIQKYGFKT